MQIVIEISEKDYKTIIKNDEDEQVQECCLCLLCRLIQAIKNGAPLPEHATNGDVIKALFPNWQFSQFGYFVSYMLDAISFHGSLHWWNSPYKKEGE